jgi:hypothetical protein
MISNSFAIYSGNASGGLDRVLVQRQADVSATINEWKRDNYEK